MLSPAEENYLKTIYKVLEKGSPLAETNQIAALMQTSAASVTDMVKKLAAKDLLQYEPYKGAHLTREGVRLATSLIRKHRLWEYFLVEKLGMPWDRVHEIAEELEHIRSEELIERLDQYLGNPRFDPHGDPIPDAKGTFTYRRQIPFDHAEEGEKVQVIASLNQDPAYLQYLDSREIAIGKTFRVIQKNTQESSLLILDEEDRQTTLTEKIYQHLMVQKI